MCSISKCSLAAFICALCTMSVAGFGMTNMDALLAKHTSPPVHRAGCGTAHVTVDDELGSREYLCDFMFTDEASRTTRYLPDAKEHDLHGRVTWLVGTENIVANKQRVVRHVKPPLQFYRQLGYDFHPQTFLSPFPRRMAMPEYLSHFQRHGGRITAADDPNTPILLIGEPTTILAVDRNTGLLQVFVHDLLSHEEQKGFKKSIRYTWKKWGDAFYLHTLEQSTETFTKVSRETESPIVTRSLKIEIRTFASLAKVNETTFRLEGLEIAEGTPVWDEATRLTSRYRSPSN
ncbi:MAG TPA: hypothetical protein P5317_12930 [Myxococcota bacterium]|jgi:hypothetical protein|nr:hypothetical protein [Myxococcota bacterium]